MFCTTANRIVYYMSANTLAPMFLGCFRNKKIVFDNEQVFKDIGILAFIRLNKLCR